MELGNGCYVLTTVKIGGGGKSTSQNTCKDGSLKVLTYIIFSIEYGKFEMQADILN